MPRESENPETELAGLRHAARRPEAPLPVLERLAQRCLERGLLDEAADAAMRAVAIDGNRAQAWHRLAIIETRRARLAEARSALEHVVALDPHSGDALNNLGTILQQLGHTDLAAERYRQSLAINPDYAEAHSNLASALGVLGAFEESLAHAQRAIALKPEYPNPYVHAAFAEADSGRFDAALAWMQRIPAGFAQNAAILAARAEILRKADRLEECVDACRAAVALDPGFGSAYNCLGMALDGLARDEEALDAFSRAAELLPHDAFPLACKSASLRLLGREADADDAMEQARAREPNSATVLYMWAVAKDFKLGERDFAAIEQRLADTLSPSYNDRMHLHFTLGGAWLQTRDAKRAFPHLEAGNRIKRGLIAYNPQADEERIARTIAAFPRERIERAADIGNASVLPVFVIGMPRSGTTLVEQILASHPQIHGGGEMRHWGQAVRRVANARGETFPLFMSALQAEEIGDMAQDYLARVGPPPPGVQRIVDKMPLNSLYAGLMHLAFPRARIIHCRRDPFDTCLSCYSKLFNYGQEFSYDLAELGRYYRAHEMLMAHWRSVLPAEVFLEIDYEDVVGDLESAARRLVAFCGLDWSEACLRFHETSRPVRTASMVQVRRPLYSSSIGRWKQFEEELAPLFAALGSGDLR